jgi:hypothetical protein
LHKRLQHLIKFEILLRFSCRISALTLGGWIGLIFDHVEHLVVHFCDNRFGKVSAKGGAFVAGQSGAS